MNGWRYIPGQGWSWEDRRLERYTMQNAFTPDAEAFRFYDDGLESSAVAIDAQGTDIGLDVTAGDIQFQLRFQVGETGTDTNGSNQNYSLEYEINNSGTWVPITASSAAIQIDSGSSLSDGTVAASDRLTGGTGADDGLGTQETGDGTTPNISGPTASNNIECVFGMLAVSAGLADSDLVDFRVLAEGATIAQTMGQPRITITKTVVSFVDMDASASTSLVGAANQNVLRPIDGDFNSSLALAGEVSKLLSIDGDFNSSIVNSARLNTIFDIDGSFDGTLASLAELAKSLNLDGSFSGSLTSLAAAQMLRNLSGDFTGSLTSDGLLNAPTNLDGSFSSSLSLAGEFGTNFCEAIKFDGSASEGFAASGSNTGTADSAFMSFSFYAYRQTSLGTKFIFNAASNGMQIGTSGASTYRIFLESGAGTNVFDWISAAGGMPEDATWRHYCGWVDVDTGAKYVALDGVEDASVPDTLLFGQTIDFTRLGIAIGADSALNNPFTGAISQLAVWPRKIDWGVAANLELVRASDGRAVPLPDDGNIDGLGAADYVFNKNVDNAHINDGDANNWAAATSGLSNTTGPLCIKPKDMVADFSSSISSLGELDVFIAGGFTELSGAFSSALTSDGLLGKFTPMGAAFTSSLVGSSLLGTTFFIDGLFSSSLISAGELQRLLGFQGEFSTSLITAGEIQKLIGLYGSIDTALSAAAMLGALKEFSALFNSSLTGAGELSLSAVAFVEMAGLFLGQLANSAESSIIRGLAATFDASLVATASQNVIRPISGDFAGTLEGDARLNALLSMSADFDTQLAANAILGVTFDINGLFESSSIFDGKIGLFINMDGSLSTSLVVNGQIDKLIGLSGAADFSLLGEGDINSIIGMWGSFDNLLIASGELEGVSDIIYEIGGVTVSIKSPSGGLTVSSKIQGGVTVSSKIQGGITTEVKP